MNRRLVVSTALSTLAVFSFAGVPDLPWTSSAVTLSGGYTQTLTQSPSEATAITLRNADLHLAQGVSLDAASTVEVAPSVSTPGTVVLPNRATVKVSAAWGEADLKKYLLIDADSLEGSFENWTFEGVPEGCRAVLRRNGGLLSAQIGSKGILLIVR